MSFRVIVFLFFVLSHYDVVLGQSENLSSFRFSLIGIGKSLPDDCLYVSEGKSQPIGTIATNYRTAVFDYSGPSVFRLYKRATDGTLELYAEVDVPKVIDDALFVLIPGKDAGGSARLIVLDDGVPRFSPGSYLFYNTTPYRIAGLVGGRKVLLSAGETAIIKPVVKPNDYFQIDLRSEQNDIWNPGFSARWRQRATTRVILFLYTDRNNPTSILSKAIPQHF